MYMYGTACDRNISRIISWCFTEYREKYAKPEDVGAAQEEKSSDEELSEDDYGSSDDGIAGQPDPWV